MTVFLRHGVCDQGCGLFVVLLEGGQATMDAVCLHPPDKACNLQGAAVHS